MTTPSDRIISPQLLLCLRPGADLSALGQLAPEEWLALARQAGWHQLAPQVYQRLEGEQAVTLQLPPQVADLLRQSYYSTLATNIQYYDVLGQVLERLQGAGMHVILLKGIYLADQVYGDLGLRPMDDLDLLVPEPELERAFGLLQAMGFQTDASVPAEIFATHRHAQPLKKDEVEIELHWTLTPSGRALPIDPHGLWAQARACTLQCGTALALSPHHLALHLMVHAAYSNNFYRQLRSLFDVHQVLTSEPIDWDALVGACQAWEAERGVYLCLRLAADLFGTRLPAGALAALRPADWTEQALGWAKGHLSTYGAEYTNPFADMLSATSLRSRLAAMVSGLFPPRRVMEKEYRTRMTGWRLLSLYPRHALTRIWKYWKLALKYARGERGELESKSQGPLRTWLKID